MFYFICFQSFFFPWLGLFYPPVTFFCLQFMFFSYSPFLFIIVATIWYFFWGTWRIPLLRSHNWMCKCACYFGFYLLANGGGFDHLTWLTDLPLKRIWVFRQKKLYFIYVCTFINFCMNMRTLDTIFTKLIKVIMSMLLFHAINLKSKWFSLRAYFLAFALHFTNL